MIPTQHLRHLLLCLYYALFCVGAVLIVTARLGRWLWREYRHAAAAAAVLGAAFYFHS
jgi:hypothetical protein